MVFEIFCHPGTDGYSRSSVVPIHEDKQHGCQEEENSQNDYCHLEMTRNRGKKQKTKTKQTIVTGIGISRKTLGHQTSPALWP